MFNYSKILKVCSVVILCLITIISIVLYRYRYASIEEDLTVNIEWGEVPSNLMMIGNIPQKIIVRIRGNPTVINSLSGKQLTYRPDLSGISSGTALFKIDQDKLILPQEVSIIGIEPQAVTFRVELIKEVDLSVNVRTIGTPSPNFMVSEIYVKPGKVSIKGPDKIIGDITVIDTMEIDLEGISESFKKEVPLDVSEALLPYISTRLVRVEVSLQEKIEKRDFLNIPVLGKDTRYRYKIRPETVALTIEGPSQSLQTLDIKKDIKVYVSLKNLKPGVYARRVKIELPGNMTLTNVKPKVFTVAVINRR